jgi:hypothetical protein
VPDLPPALPTDLVGEVRRTIVDLRSTRMAATAWPAVAGDLGRLAAAVEHGDEALVRSTLVPLSQATFEGKVRGRLAAADKRAAGVVATKQSAALPSVGAVSAILLIGIGYLLGGWPVAALTGVLAAFIFAVALAGTRTNRDRSEQRRRALAPTAEHTEAAPRQVAEAIRGIEGRLNAAEG